MKVKVNKRTAINEHNKPWYCSTFGLYMNDYKPCKGKIGKGECKECRIGPEKMDINGTGKRIEKPDSELNEKSLLDNSSDYIPKKEAAEAIKDDFIEPEFKTGKKSKKYFNPNIGRWFIKYRPSDGKIINKDTGTDDRALAAKMQKEIVASAQLLVFCSKCKKQRDYPLHARKSFIDAGGNP